jgi:hypothetical protein
MLKYTPLDQLKERLITHILNKEVEAIKLLFHENNFLSNDEKEKLSLYFLEQLLMGNGWLVSVVGGRGDGGADILMTLSKS